jgi:hypothetical protein
MKRYIASLSALIAAMILTVPAMSQNPPQVATTQAPVQQWEYLYADTVLLGSRKLGGKSTLVLRFEGKVVPLQDGMAELGKQGWELTVAYPMSTDTLYTVYVFKRRL